MPIKCSEQIVAATQEQFHEIDEIVLGIAYSVQNEFGRFMDERIYQAEIASRCTSHGLQVTREMAIRVWHAEFNKEYFVDLMINQCVPVETKAVELLTKSHQNQLLNYLFPSGTNHGSLINLRPTSVKRQFVSTTLTAADRRQFEFQYLQWRVEAPIFEQLHAWIESLVNDWGAFLDFRLYREAITHFLGGPEVVVNNLPVYSNGSVIGHQKVHLLSPKFALSFSAIKKGRDGMHEHLERFLRHTLLKGAAWINLNGHDIEFTTILND